MKTESFSMSAVIPGEPREVFDSWLSSKGHSAMTQSPARASARVGGAFTAWDGYITGKNLELEPGKRIVQSWRTTEFPADAPDSRVEIRLEPATTGTRLILKHTLIPAGQGGGYRQGWRDYYFVPMKRFFGRKS